MNFKSYKTISLLCCFSLVIAVILSIIDFWCFNNEFYQSEYNQLKTADSIGMSAEDLEKTTNVLLTYLKDRANTLEVEATIKGESRQVFNQREIAHMEDVRNLYLNTMLVRNICLGFYFFTLIILLVKKKIGLIYKSYIKALLIFFCIFGAIGIFCAIDFNTFWTSFHEIFFSNDLWLLNPKTDILIMMVPSKFFFDLCVSIIFSIFLVLTLLLILLFIFNKKVFTND